MLSSITWVWIAKVQFEIIIMAYRMLPSLYKTLHLAYRTLHIAHRTLLLMTLMTLL